MKKIYSQMTKKIIFRSQQCVKIQISKGYPKCLLKLIIVKNKILLCLLCCMTIIAGANCAIEQNAEPRAPFVNCSVSRIFEIERHSDVFFVFLSLAENNE